MKRVDTNGRTNEEKKEESGEKEKETREEVKEGERAVVEVQEKERGRGEEETSNGVKEGERGVVEDQEKEREGEGEELQPLMMQRVHGMDKNKCDKRNGDRGEKLEMCQRKQRHMKRQSNFMTDHILDQVPKCENKCRERKYIKPGLQNDIQQPQSQHPKQQQKQCFFEMRMKPWSSTRYSARKVGSAFSCHNTKAGSLLAMALFLTQLFTVSDSGE